MVFLFTDLRLVLLFFGSLLHTTQRAWSLLSGSDTLKEKTKILRTEHIVGPDDLMPEYLSPLFIPSNIVTSLALRPESIHHKAGESSEVQAVPSGRT